jgi:hypothetical protein
MTKKKQSIEEQKKVLQQINDLYTTSRRKGSELMNKISDHTDSIFNHDSYSVSEKIERIGRIKSAYVNARSKLEPGGYTPPLQHEDRRGRLSEVLPCPSLMISLICIRSGSIPVK